MNDFVNHLGDIDIDTPNRHHLLTDLVYIPACVIRNNKFANHNTGVYFHQVPENPLSGTCSIAYDRAEEQGCYKIDLLNNHIYDGVKSENHLVNLINTTPMWELLDYQEVVSQLAHINNHFELVTRLKPRNIKQLAMLLALIRPGKRYLVNRCESQGWASLEPEIWRVDPNQAYVFKKSHAISLAVAIQVQLNLLVETTAESCYNEVSQ